MDEAVAPGEGWRPTVEIASGRTARVYEGPPGTIVKVFEPWMPAGGIEREATVARLLTDQGLPAPALLGTLDVDGRRGLVFERLTGETMIVRMRRAPLSIRSLGRALARLQARIAAQRAPSLDAYRDRLQVAIEGAEGLPADVRHEALAALAGLPDGDALIHGDFHPDNVMLTPRGPVVIDWMTAARGVPAADVARTLVLMTVGRLPSGRRLDALMVRVARRFAVDAYRAERLRVGDVVAGDVARWLQPVAAARFDEAIPTDGPQLLELARSATARAALAGSRP